MNQLSGEGESDKEDISFHTIYSMSQEISKVAPITFTININGMKITFEVDTDCGDIKQTAIHTTMEENSNIRTKSLLTEIKKKSGECLGVLGMAQVKVLVGRDHSNADAVRRKHT